MFLIEICLLGRDERSSRRAPKHTPIFNSLTYLISNKDNLKIGNNISVLTPKNPKILTK